jgi:hypothetical protein
MEDRPNDGDATGQKAQSGISSLQRYYLEQATLHASRAAAASVRKMEWLFVGALLLFIYVVYVSPPRQELILADAFTVLLIVGCTALTFFYESLYERENGQVASASIEQIKALRKFDPSATVAPQGRATEAGTGYSGNLPTSEA